MIHGDCLEQLEKFSACSMDSLVTDPPAGIGFMGKDWDHHKGGRDDWVSWLTCVMAECLRVLKPGGHALVWALPRTSHWTMTALEDAGFEIRDVVTHLFGTGFPKSLDVSKAIDKEAGAEREAVGPNPYNKNKGPNGHHSDKCAQAGKLSNITAPATDAARQWEGFGTALKPACEFWILCRKPISEKTVAKNVLKWGTGALNIDASRIAGHNPSIDRRATARKTGNAPTSPGELSDTKWINRTFPEVYATDRASEHLGRFPANLVLDEEAAQALDEQSVANGIHSAGKARAKGKSFDRDKSIFGIGHAAGDSPRYEDTDNPGASRFFYVAKASKSDRGDGNTHPTVKSTKLMSYLVRLVTPPGGTVLDPFMGSGSTGVAAKAEGMQFIGIEQDQGYVETAKKRLAC